MIKPKVKVGALLVAALGAMGLVIVMLGQVSLKKGYEFSVLFETVSDLPSSSVVKMYGVKVGRVDSIRLFKDKAKVKVWIRDEIKIHTDTKIEILRMGLIGNTFLSITRGTAKEPFLKAGDTVVGISPISYGEILDKLMVGLTEVTRAFEGLEDIGGVGKDLGDTFKNLSEMTLSVNKAMGEEGEKLSHAIDSLNQLLKSMDKVVGTEFSGTAESIKKFGAAADELTFLLRKIKKGEGTVGKLISSEEYSKKIGEAIESVYEASNDIEDAVKRFKGFDSSWDSGVNFSPKDELLRSYAGITLKTSSRRFLNLGFENIDPSGGSYKNYDEGGDRLNSLTVKAGKELGDFRIFAGAIRSSGGVGADWEPLRILNFGTAIFEFSRSENPRWSISSSLKLTDFLKLDLNYEDLLERRDLRAGLELEIK
jgi:phospholipid/cholesterol/gamma-HCH transport system substrate-binding protein